IDATGGAVRLGERVTDTVATGSGVLRFEASTQINGLTLAMDAEVGTPDANQTIFASGDGVTIDADLTLAAGQNRDAYLWLSGEQTLGGTGTITLSDANAPVGSFDNQIIFDGTLAATEVLTVASDLVISGQGFVSAREGGDTILLEGTLLADDGILRVQDLEGLEGTLGVTADGELDVETALTLTERGTLSVGIAGSGVSATAGRIDVESGLLSLEGTLALDVAADFTANLGDTFDIITSVGGFLGEFDGFQGFDLAGNQAFKLVETDPNTLSLEVTTDQDAQSFIGSTFTPDPRPSFQRVDLALDDAGARAVDANIIADFTSAPTTSSIAFENVVFKVDVVSESLAADFNIDIEQDVFLDNVTLSFTGSSLAEYDIDVNGTQTIGGTGVIEFAKFDTGLGRGTPNRLQFNSTSQEREVLTIEEGITLRGDANVTTTSPAEDHIRFLGTLQGTSGGILNLGGIDNDGAAFGVDASDGVVAISSFISDAVITEAAGNSGKLNILDNTVLQTTTFEIDSILDGSGASDVDVSVVGGMVLDGSTMTLAGFNNQSSIDFRGEQQIGGIGTFDMSENVTGPTDNAVFFDGSESFSETLIFGEDITIRGRGVIATRESEDKVSILGTVIGEGSGLLSINNLDNNDDTITIDASAGRVGFGGGIANATLAAASGNTGAIDILTNGGLRNVTLGIDTRIDAELTALSATVREGLELDGSTLSLSGSEFASATLTVFGAQTLGGNGTLLLSDENSIDGRSVTNRLVFNGVESGSETFRIAEDIDLVGAGDVTVSTGDILDFDGDATARGGTLSLEGVEEIVGDLTAETGARMEFDRTLGLAASAGLIIGLAGDGLNALAGTIEISGLLQRGGIFRFDIAPDFDAEIGTEFEVVRTTEGFTDSFESVENATIDGTRALALVEDGNSIFARVVDFTQAGQQLTRADFPAPDLPVLSSNFENVTLGAALAGGPEVNVSGGVWSGVDLAVSATVQTSRVLTVTDGLTIEDRLSVDGFGRVDFAGEQTVDGTGVLELTQTGASRLRNVNQDTGIQETVTFGADLTIQGQGFADISNTADRFRFLGDVIGIGDELRLSYIDNGGAVLSLDSASGGWVTLQNPIENAVIEVAQDADVRVTSATLTGVSLGGAGVTRIQTATVSDLTVIGQAEIEGVAANQFATLTVTDGLVVDGTLAVSGTGQRTAALNFTGGQLVDGTGEILLSRNNAIGEEAVFNSVSLTSQLFNEREDLVFGSDLTLRGAGTVGTNGSADRIQILGTAIAEGGPLVLQRVDNQGQELTVDPGQGDLRFGTLLEDAVITAASGATGFVGFESSVAIRTTTFNADARAAGAAATSSIAVNFEDAVTINGTFELATQPNRSATLNILGEQVIDGTGEILLSRANLNPDQSGTNQVDFDGDFSGTEEILTFGADLGISGNGFVFASQAEDSIRILGQVTGGDGANGGELILRDVDNGGAALNIDATGGAVRLGERVTDTVATGSGVLGFEASTQIDGLTLAMDAEVGTPDANQTIFASGDGVTIDADLTLAAGQNRSAYLWLSGEQTLGGTGTITLSDANAPVGSFDNQIIFDGTLAATEVLTVASDLVISGQGFVSARDGGDTVLLEGTLLADDGILRVQDLEGLEGTLGVTADGELDVETALTLTERGILSVGLAGSGANIAAGRIDVESGLLSLEGTLALDVAADFTANLGDTFDIITSVGG
ncbi:MAG: hypothetical protein AAGF14_06535, partial [Pseudomonadota bacterium]